VSNPDSFIDEVTEEVRRDKLFGVMRRYGWIGIVVILVIVGGAALREYRIAQHQAESQVFGDALLDALDAPDAAERRAALAAVPATGERQALLNLLLSSDPAGDRQGTLAALDAVVADTSLPASYHDLAVLRRAIVAGSDIGVAERRAALDAIAAPGRPYRTLALEQLAYLMVEEGSVQPAIEALEALRVDQESPQNLRRRAEQMIVALGGTPAAS
jgi:hypothetical protein